MSCSWYYWLNALALGAIIVAISLPILDPNMTGTSEDEALSFKVDWYDSTIDQTREFKLIFYPRDNSVEMYDLKHKKLFLSRIHCDTVQRKDFFLGNTVIVFARRLVINAYSDDFTERLVGRSSEATFGMVKPDGMKNLGRIVEMIEEAGFTIGQAKSVLLTRQQAANFYKEHEQRSFFPFGRDTTENAAHGSDSDEAAKRELSLFFPSSFEAGKRGPLDIPQSSALMNGRTTCCVIKPHALKDGLAGRMMAEIQEAGFNVTAAQTFHLKYEHAEEFYEIYKGIVPDYSGMAKQLSSGRCLALELEHSDLTSEETVTRFRDVVGPADPELARDVYGRSKEENALHCTDLPEDGPLEVEYFFKILS